ncbi:Transposon Ty3-G Gag-Pol polyprotein [Vitis vinifera]|uniref:Transposon Ty3-G Gag-Pol polyprotein n=1 Tax=Vitis vinifera TaxID=29760 RepID=A0A438IIK0_VITVI|nr:Transposon Ty3-G Gag-Pol polyprotein [Vitis vinifera]
MCCGSRTVGVAPDIHNERPRERPLPTYHALWDESSDSTRVSSKRQRDKRPQLSDAMRARLGPQAPGKERPPKAATWENSHIINYEPPKGFLVPKFSTYDGSSDLFDHIMHYRQLMTLDIGNDALLCKRPLDHRQGKQSHSELPPLTPIIVSYEKLLPMIRELFNFRAMQESPLLGRKAHKSGVSEAVHPLDARGGETSQSRTSGTPRAPITPRAVINYIHGGSLDEEYDSKRKRQRDFDVRWILVDPGSSTDLLQGGSEHRGSAPTKPRRFTWAHSNMIGIHPSVAFHRLNILPSSRPVRKKVRRFHPDRQKIIRDEVDKLLEVGFIREVEYSDWLANVVVALKKEGKWRVCVDYTNLNNACPNSFPLPRIEQIVDSTAGQGMLSFLDAFSGYHQIPMALADEEKTAFLMPHGLYCYKVMPFGLKNASATYQRLMTKIFRPLVDRTMEVYIDDIVVKSKTRGDHTHHLQEVFHLLRRYDMKLNPSKCAFGVSVGKFLGFMVTQRGIEVSLDQIKNFPNDLLETGNRTRRSDGPCKLTEPLARQDPEWDCCYNLQLEQAIRLGFPASNNEAGQGRAHDAIPNKSKRHPATVGRVDYRKSPIEAPTCNAIEESQEWMRVIKKYLRTGTLPEDSKQMHKIRVQAARFTLIRECLYKRSFTDLYLRHAPVPHVPSKTLNPITSPWPFAQWGMDIVGPLPIAAAQKKFLLVATDYFSKWVEVEAYVSIKDKDVTKFVWKNIICRFGIPQAIIADNEATNKTLLTALKKRLEQAKGKWVEELPNVLWSYRTMPGRLAGNTPFALAYGMDAVILMEIGLPTIRTIIRGQKDENLELKRNLD